MFSVTILFLLLRLERFILSCVLQVRRSILYSNAAMIFRLFSLNNSSERFCNVTGWKKLYYFKEVAGMYLFKIVGGSVREGVM